jgi:hypothetical protein
MDPVLFPPEGVYRGGHEPRCLFSYFGSPEMPPHERPAVGRLVSLRGTVGGTPRQQVLISLW